MEGMWCEMTKRKWQLIRQKDDYSFFGIRRTTQHEDHWKWHRFLSAMHVRQACRTTWGVEGFRHGAHHWHWGHWLLHQNTRYPFGSRSLVRFLSMRLLASRTNHSEHSGVQLGPPPLRACDDAINQGRQRCLWLDRYRKKRHRRRRRGIADPGPFRLISGSDHKATCWAWTTKPKGYGAYVLRVSRQRVQLGAAATWRLWICALSLWVYRPESELFSGVFLS